MRGISIRYGMLLGVVGLLVVHSSAEAQSADVNAPDTNEPCTPGVGSSVENTVIGVSDVPYIATLKVTFDQRQSDRRAIHGVTRTLSARNSSGKARMETSTGCWRDKDGRLHDRLNVRIADPAAGTLLDWNTDGAVLKVARLLYQPEFFPRSLGFPEWKNAETALNPPGQPARTVRTELLGTKMLNDIQVYGKRTTITVPSDEKNGAAVVVERREQWVSLELGVVMSELVDDPLRGRTEMEMESFSLKEPDPALFIPPNGYTIVQTYPTATTPK